MNAAFGKYLVKGAPAFVPRGKLSPSEACDIIIASGGVPGLAHPAKVGWDGIVAELVNAGLRAIEVYHTDHSSQVAKRYKRLAEQFGLIVTGGSDSHGTQTDKPIAIGSVTVGVDSIRHLRRAAKSV
jgi:3',5'-nucleoside bisphosphate phosphatase